MANLTDASRNAAAQNTNEDYSRIEIDGQAFGKSHPTTALGGTLVSNGLRDFNPPNGDTYLGTVVENPTVVTDGEDLSGTHIAYSEDGTTQYKVVNVDDEATKIDEDDQEVLFDGNIFGYDRMAPADEFEFEDERVIFKFGGGSMRNIARTLDQNGAESGAIRRDANGDVLLSNNGYPMQSGALFEYREVDEDNTESNMIRATLARDDLVGKDVYVLLDRYSNVEPEYDGDSYWTTVFGTATEEVIEHTEAALGENEEVQFAELDGTDLVALRPREGEVPLSAIMETGWLEWSYDEAVEELAAQGVEVGSPAAQQRASSQNSSGSTSESAESGLTDSELAVVDQIEDALPQDVDSDGVRSTVDNNEGLFDEEDDREAVTQELEDRLVQ